MVKIFHILWKKLGGFNYIITYYYKLDFNYIITYYYILFQIKFLKHE